MYYIEHIKATIITNSLQTEVWMYLLSGEGVVPQEQQPLHFATKESGVQVSVP
jgi:hypothetical protein